MTMDANKSRNDSQNHHNPYHLNFDGRRSKYYNSDINNIYITSHTCYAYWDYSIQ